MEILTRERIIEFSRDVLARHEYNHAEIIAMLQEIRGRISLSAGTCNE